MQPNIEMQPTLDHYNGRRLIGVYEGDVEGGAEGAHWHFELEGGVRVFNLNEDYPMPVIKIDVENPLTLTRVTMNSSMTELHFGTSENPFQTMVTLDPTQYTVSDPVYGGEPVRVQMGEQIAVMAEPPATEVSFEEPKEEETTESPVEGTEKPSKPRRRRQKAS